MEESPRCPIDQTELTAFNQYNLEDGIICRTCAKKMGLLGSHQSLKLAQAARTLITVNVAREYVSNSKTIAYQELLKSYETDQHDTDSEAIDSKDQPTPTSLEDTKKHSVAPTSDSSTAKSLTEDSSSTNVKPEKIADTPIDSDKQKKFWKGSGVDGLIIGVILGLVVGILNMIFLNIPWLGRIIFIATWLIIGHNKNLSDRIDKAMEPGGEPTEATKKAAEYREKHPAKYKTATHTAKQQTTVIIQNTEPKPKKQKVPRKVPHCPKCKSTNIQILDNKRKFSVGKTVVGGAAFGIAGASIGAFAGKHGKKYHAVCMQCGKKFLVKL